MCANVSWCITEFVEEVGLAAQQAFWSIMLRAHLAVKC